MEGNGLRETIAAALRLGWTQVRTERGWVRLDEWNPVELFAQEDVEFTIRSHDIVRSRVRHLPITDPDYKNAPYFTGVWPLARGN